MSTRFTVAIPTRNRRDTLQWALKTCTTQLYDDLEIIVSDNFSSDGTEAMVREIDDPRIRYVNTGRAVSMSENFEFALSHAGSGYVTMLGDDDGLLPGALTELDPLLADLGSDALVWSMQNYYWPGFFERQLANMLNMSLDQRPSVHEVASADILRRVASFATRYVALPSPYFGFVRREVLDAATGRNGRFFNSITPDIYAGVAVAATIPRFHVSDRAFSLSGQSRHSNGASVMAGGAASVPDSAAGRFVRENTLPFHPDLVYSPSVPILVAETFLQVRDHLRDGPELSVDMSQVLRAALSDQEFLVNAGVRAEIEASVRAVGELHGMNGFADQQIRRARLLRIPRLVRSVFTLVAVTNPVFDCAPYGARNIYDASLVFRQLVARYPSALARRRATLRARARKALRIIKTAAAKLGRSGEPAESA
jgi:glycosyltransferase involved in cell wall biosynthesis